MISSAKLAEIASVLGDPTRISMVMSLKQDGQLSAGDLAKVGNIAPSTASEHLSRLTDAGLLEQTKRGRHKYFRIAVPDLFDILDGLEALACTVGADREVMPPGMVHTRLCYDHLAGRLACGITDAMFDANYLRHTRQGLKLTSDGAKWLASRGADVATMMSAPRNTAVLCRDWTENRHHIGGAVGSAILAACKRMDWVRTRRGNSTVEITPKGHAGLRGELGLDLRANTI